MDPLDILLNKDKIVPFYQPIISADKQIVVGYEVFARMKTESGPLSLGSFFTDDTIPEEYRNEIDDYVQTLALERFIETPHLYLFLNINIHSIIRDDADRLMEKLQFYQTKGLSFDRVVLEIKEKDYASNYSDIKHLITYIQSTGVKIAIGDVGISSSNLERLANLKPNIVKVNVGFLEGDIFPELYRDVLHSLSLLTRKLGSTLLFEGVDNYTKLNFAWRNGSRYYQGFYLGKPNPSFVDAEFCKDTIKKEFHRFVEYERKKIKGQLMLTEKLSQTLKATLKTIKSYNDLDETVLKIANALTTYTFRVYIVDHDGFQQSSNAVKSEEGNWELEKDSRQKNWSWRPYFIENIVRMDFEQKGILSDLYTDIDKDEMIRTYSFPLENALFLFIDIPYSYLYEQDGLL
ncbi:EAL-associated domain-containing protein [Evansella sp. AB-P1]|uniref:EAL domain-containing protein n=1 Tax=Evansella sp. AB-P1 TaxID=3037653 RepID=UPI00241D8DE0|nr:EAL-associated domain-containing protein [Evansella sp. AB-P1]MDG5787081.1 EAL-associated domain-containing protein [Evansella sp. AB-P1]